MRAGKNSLEETRIGNVRWKWADYGIKDETGVTKGEKRSELENIAWRGSERSIEELTEMMRKEVKREKGKGRNKH